MDLLQNAIVTIVVLGAVATLVRRVAGFARPSAGAPACKSCASGAPCHPAASSTPQAHPAVLHRPSAR